MTSYEIVRFYQDPSIPQKVIERGLTLAEAREWVQDPETSSSTATRRSAVTRTNCYGPWFEGYRQEAE